MVIEIALARLAQERAMWKKDHPFGFVARPMKRPDGSLNMLTWECGIPGPVNSPWRGGLYYMKMHFKEDYPLVPPKCLPKCLVALPLHKDWRTSLTVKDILLGIQNLIETPNMMDPAQKEPFETLGRDPAAYDELVRKYAKKFNMDSVLSARFN
ncbi:ubiquitin--protein ligase [Trichuris suis]|nr:ubiquitin--protein ligase [Trichuris suis]